MNKRNESVAAVSYLLAFVKKKEKQKCLCNLTFLVKLSDTLICNHEALFWKPGRVVTEKVHRFHNSDSQSHKKTLFFQKTELLTERAQTSDSSIWICLQVVSYSLVNCSL